MFKEDLRDQLVLYGYLAEQIPPFFTTIELNKYYHELIKVKVKNGHYDPARFTVAKNNLTRRVIKFPNPSQQIKLIDYIIKQKIELEKIFNQNPYTLDNPFEYSDGLYSEQVFFNLPRLVDKKKSNFTENVQKKLELSMGYRYCFKIDIANFYDSIYTHSIEWASIGRLKAKRQKAMGSNIGRELDRLVRNTNSKETAGIPTGPFTSRIISELILEAIDRELKILSEEENNSFTFTHYVDDYEFYFRNEADIHYVKNKIIEVFNQYNLKINEQKTSIEEYPFHKLIDLQKEYEYYIQKYNETKDAKHIQLLFFKADEFNKAGIKGSYKYLYKMIKTKEKINLEKGWQVAEPFLIGHLLIDQSLSQYIVKVLLLYRDIITDRFKKEVYKNLKISINKHLHNEAHWLFWALLKIDYPFSKEDLLCLFKYADDDFMKIMVIHTIYKLKFDREEDIKELLNSEIKFISELTFESEHWLLIHEWYINNWKNYKSLESLYSENPFFQVMKKRQITFISDSL